MKKKWMRPLVLVTTLIAAVAAPHLLPYSFEIDEYTVSIYVHHLILAMLFLTMAMGLNLSIGFAGLLDLGFIAFVAVGSYIMAIGLTVYTFMPWWALLPLCAVGATTLRVLLGATCLRLRGDYLAIVTLGFGEIMRVVLKNNIFGLTGGPDGIFLNRDALPEFLKDELMSYYVSALLALVACFAVYRWSSSRIGRMWEAVREDEVAAVACGVNVFRARIWAYGLGGVFAGLAGGLYAINNMIANPVDYEFIESVKVVVMVVLGGMGSIGGVVAGSFFFIILMEVFRELAQYRLLIFGAVLVALMVWRPQGLAGRKS